MLPNHTFISFSIDRRRKKKQLSLSFQDDDGESLREIILSFQLSVLKVPELMRPDGKSTYSSKFFLPIKYHGKLSLCVQNSLPQMLWLIDKKVSNREILFIQTLCCLKPSSLSGLFITCMEANTTTNPLLSPAHHWSGCQRKGISCQLNSIAGLRALRAADLAAPALSFHEVQFFS